MGLGSCALLVRRKAHPSGPSSHLHPEEGEPRVWCESRHHEDPASNGKCPVWVLEPSVLALPRIRRCREEQHAVPATDSCVRSISRENARRGLGCLCVKTALCFNRHIAADKCYVLVESWVLYFKHRPCANSSGLPSAHCPVGAGATGHLQTQHLRTGGSVSMQGNQEMPCSLKGPYPSQKSPDK